MSINEMNEGFEEGVSMIDLDEEEEEIDMAGTGTDADSVEIAQEPLNPSLTPSTGGQFSMFAEVPVSSAAAPKSAQKTLQKPAVKTPAAPVWNADSDYDLPIHVQFCTRDDELTPDMFLGQTKVKGSDILNYLKDNFNLQVLREVKRVTFIYEQAEALLFLLIKSPPNGGELPMNKETTSPDGKTVSLRRSVGVFTKPTDGGLGGSFTLSLPKIPQRLLSEVFAFFAEVYAKHGTEATARILYHPDTGYELFVPEQKVTRSKVLDMERTRFFRETVLDIHSHGVHQAYVSPDDLKAYAHRVALIGIVSPSHPEEEPLFAAFYDGYEIPLSQEVLFDGEPFDTSSLSNEYLDRVTVVDKITEEDWLNA